MAKPSDSSLSPPIRMTGESRRKRQKPEEIRRTRRRRGFTRIPRGGGERREAKERRHHMTGAQGALRTYLRGDPIREVGGVGLLPALCRRRTACRRNVLRSRRKVTVSSLPGAAGGRHIIRFPFFQRPLRQTHTRGRQGRHRTHTHKGRRKRGFPTRQQTSPGEEEGKQLLHPGGRKG